MSETRLVFLPRHEDICEQWELVRPLFETAVNEAVHGEFTITQLLDMALQKTGLISYIEDDSGVLMALAMELKHYPNMSVLNVMAMAGQRMGELFARHSPEIAAFARSCGVTHFEASGSKAMARMLRFNCGWDFVYETVRFKL